MFYGWLFEYIFTKNNSRIELLDVLGNQIIMLPLYSYTSKQEQIITIPIAGLSNGMYMIRVKNGEHILNEKVIINK